MLLSLLLFSVAYKASFMARVLPTPRTLTQVLFTTPNAATTRAVAGRYSIDLADRDALAFFSLDRHLFLVVHAFAPSKLAYHTLTYSGKAVYACIFALPVHKCAQ